MTPQYVSRLLRLTQYGAAGALVATAGASAFAAPSADPPFSQIIRDWIAHDGPPGVALAVRQDGQTAFYCFGEADRTRHLAVTPDSVFELASITKTFTTTLLALSVDRGEMSLSDTASKYLPSLQQGSDIARVTLGQLATHTSGLSRAPGTTPWHPMGQAYTLPEVFRYLQEWKAPRPPGAKYEYSNIGVGIIGYVVAQQAKQPLMALYTSEILLPLGMGSTGIQLTEEMRSHLVQGYGPKGAEVPRTRPSVWPAGGALCSSARDMGQFLTANLGEGAGPSPLLEAMRHTQEGIFRVNPTFVQAWAWQVMRINNTTVIDKNGSLVGSSTYIGMIPARHLGIVILANQGKKPATKYGRQILLLLAGAGKPPEVSGTAPESD